MHKTLLTLKNSIIYLKVQETWLIRSDNIVSIFQWWCSFSLLMWYAITSHVKNPWIAIYIVHCFGLISISRYTNNIYIDKIFLCIVWLPYFSVTGDPILGSFVGACSFNTSLISDWNSYVPCISLLLLSKKNLSSCQLGDSVLLSFWFQLSFCSQTVLNLVHALLLVQPHYLFNYYITYTSSGWVNF